MNSHDSNTTGRPLGDIVELFHTAQQVAYATLEVNGHRETWALQSKEFRLLRQQNYYALTGTMPSLGALRDEVRNLEGRARFEGPELPVHLRIAQLEHRIYLDLTNPDWEVVEITGTGWRVMQDPPVKFRRTPSMAGLPHPCPGGTIAELRPFVNVASEDDWRLLVSFIVSTVRPYGPYPALVLLGPHGTAKSTLMRVVRALIDPSHAPIQRLPRSERDLFIRATNGWVLAFDNLSALSSEASDALCHLTTGGGRM